MCFNLPEKSRGDTALKRWWREAPGVNSSPSLLGLAISRPSLLCGFPNGFQPRCRHSPLLGLRRCGRLRLLLFLRRPPRSLCGGDPGAARFAHRAALRRSHGFRCGRGCWCGSRGLWPARTALPELRFDLGYLRGNPAQLALIPDDGHLQDGVVYLWHIGVLPRTPYCDRVLISLAAI
jgi:hypothetical protein